MRRAVAAVLAVGTLLYPGVLCAEPVRDAGGALLSCPDPSVLNAGVGQFRYYLVCTSDYDANSYPIRGSNDLVHWRLLGYVFPDGSHPWWALPPPVGRYWAPAIYRIAGRWVVYFAAESDPSKVHLAIPRGNPDAPNFVIGVAFARSLSGPWRSKLLHYRGQFNAVTREHENYGGVIDPSVARDALSGQLYLFWAEQSTSIWAGKLAGDGLSLDPHIHLELWGHQGWECRTSSGRCVIEGPEETYRGGWFYLFFSGASTWNGTYAVGAAVSSDPLHHEFTPLSSNPILSSGPDWTGPGGTSAPVTGPDGRQYILYHAQNAPNPLHVSADRYLMLGRLHWDGLDGYFPLVNHGRAG